VLKDGLCLPEPAMSELNLPHLLLEHEAAKLLRVSTRTLARIRKAGKIRFMGGRPIRIAYEDLIDFVKSEILYEPGGGAKKQRWRELWLNSLSPTEMKNLRRQEIVARVVHKVSMDHWRRQYGKKRGPRVTL
jgi:excisionase family DNA binding protein